MFGTHDLWAFLAASFLAFAHRSKTFATDANAGLNMASASAEEGEGGTHSPIYRWINFFILVGGLAYVLRKPLAQFFAQRSDSIRKGLDEGRLALDASGARLRAVEDRLAHFENEMAAFRETANREMAEERERLRQSSAREAEKMMESVRLQLDTAGKAARLELRRFAGEQAVALAEQMIRARLDESGQRLLVDQFVARLARKENSN